MTKGLVKYRFSYAMLPHDARGWKGWGREVANDFLKMRKVIKFESL